MASREEARGVARRLHGLGGGQELVRKAAARELARRDPVDANELVGELVALARAGDEPSTCVLRAFVQALEFETDQIPHAQQLARLAAVQSLYTVAALFPGGAPRLQQHPEAARRADAVNFSESLGHQKMKARNSRDPDELSRYAMNSNPLVMRNLLLNPRLTEPLVVRIASRRPARPEALLELWRSPRWASRHSVRRALVFNPYVPPDVAAKIVPLLNGADLQELASDTSVHPALRDQAKLLLVEGRPRVQAVDLEDDPSTIN